jgi:hypothetical protein
MISSWAIADIEDALQSVPASLRRQITIRAVEQWPPKPGCSWGPYHGVPRLWADFSLSEWVATAPGVLKWPTLMEAETMDAIVARLRRSGEGAQVLWGLDLQGGGFEPNDLVCIGPRLSDQVVDDVEHLFATYLGEHFWGPINEPNQHCTYNGVRCYETTWAYGVAPSR